MPAHERTSDGFSVIDDDGLAARYLAYWKQLEADTKAAHDVSKNLQGKTLRSWDTKSKQLRVDDATLESWFSPNTPKARSSKHTNEARPVDMSAVVKHIDRAKHAILFLSSSSRSPTTGWTATSTRTVK